VIGVEKEVRRVSDRDGVNYARPERDFDPLDGVQAQQAEFPVEVVDVQDLLKRRSRQKALVRRLLKRPHVDQQAVIPHPLKGLQRRHGIGDEQPPALEMRQERGGRQGRLSVRRG
jgi:hypothetical protein